MLTIRPLEIYSGYSAHEHTILYTSSSTALPQDIVIEALISLVIVSTGLVLGAEKLKPVSWSEWAEEVEKEGDARNPYFRLEERYSFWNVRVSYLYLNTWYLWPFPQAVADWRCIGEEKGVCGLDARGC